MAKRVKSLATQIVLCYCSIASCTGTHSFVLFPPLPIYVMLLLFTFSIHHQQALASREWKMAGLGVVLEAQKSSSINNKTSQPQVINKTTMNTMVSTYNTSTSTSTINQPPSSSPFETSTFLHHCFLCNKRLLPGKDIYMYK